MIFHCRTTELSDYTVQTSKNGIDIHAWTVDAISISFFNPYQTSITENVWNCLLRMNIWKLSSSARKSCSVYQFQKHYMYRENVVFLAPRNVSLEIQQLFSHQKLFASNSRFTEVFRLKIVWKLREILQFHNKCRTQYWITSFRWRIRVHLCINSIV